MAMKSSYTTRWDTICRDAQPVRHSSLNVFVGEYLVIILFGHAEKSFSCKIKMRRSSPGCSSHGGF
ncbi:MULTISPECIES: hypothetical protein [Rhizobium/Agrobacterium group]|uniref:hypothetical protein n=1 Tax=Rhizobium sp. P007 TaxID=285908 RepID=UPI00142E312B|nr:MULTISPECIES: hypothetical protein [Rhizobium/Agrobacterium group]CAD7048535.1 hypothetical protein RP007_05215 [Rhizobium sp. P007]CAD7049044.1 hypothetical protein RP007_05278 [Rhizobium sp. P007]